MHLRQVGVIAAIVFLVVLLPIVIFSVASNQSSSSTSRQLKLVDYLNGDTAVQLTQNGPVVADENHRSWVITVSASRRNFTAYKGYGRQVRVSRDYPNNQPAYEDFMLALQKDNFTRGTAKTDLDERGLCPSGQRYDYELLKDGQDVLKLASNTCGDASTFRGSTSTVIALFERQIPTFASLENAQPAGQ